MAIKRVDHLEVLEMLRMDLNSFFYMIPQLVQANVALERISEFLYSVRPKSKAHLQMNVTTYC